MCSFKRMKMNESDKEYFLSGWIEGRITDEELKAKVSPPDFNAYLQLRQSLAGLSFPEPDLEKHYRAIKDKKAESLERKARTIQWPVWFSAAAAVLLLFGIYQFVTPNVQSTGYGQSAKVQLADGSEVTLNSRSSLTYPNFFTYRRKLRLDGEAFFKVQKGQTFTVETNLGKVSVLGTQFNVIAQKDYFEVVCYQGKVKVGHRQSALVLEKGEAVRFYKGSAEEWEPQESTPAWLNHESTFKNAPLETVLLQFANQYKRKVVYPDSIRAIRFTGSFTHLDMPTALRSICTPLQMRFTPTTDGKIVISE